MDLIEEVREGKAVISGGIDEKCGGLRRSSGGGGR